MPPVYRLSLLCLLMLLPALATAAPAPEVDPVALLGGHETTGAAAGYVEDRVCGTCHAALHASYQEVGMARSFAAAANAERIEDFGEVFHHAPSDRHYQVVENGEGLLFRRWQLDAAGARINEIELPIAWVLGSGNRTRSYLYRAPAGELFMLPIGWYSEDGIWEMSPGFENATHQGVTRRIKRECMFCHDAFPEVDAGSDVHWGEQRFPETLPEGTGCQRCHGPGAEHVRTAATSSSSEAIRGAIVNPARLPPHERDSVCFQCHMLPSIAAVGARRFGRADYGFRPGEALDDYILHVEVRRDGLAREDDFEINHHGYRFFQSRCYQESAGAFACISCHDPHSKPASAEIRAASSAVCLDCHAQPEALHASADVIARETCVDCHMPRRRTRDVIHVTMTDHLIAPGPFDREALVAPREAEHPAVTEIDLLPFGAVPEDATARAYTAAAALRAGRNIPSAVETLEAALPELEGDAVEARLDLGRGYLQLGRSADTVDTMRALVAEHPDVHAAHSLLGIALLAQGRTDDAVQALERALALQVDPETRFNLALARIRAGDRRRAEEDLDAAIAERPTLARAWRYKALLARARGDDDTARRALERAVALEPNDLSAQQDLVDFLRSTGDVAEARRRLMHANHLHALLNGRASGR